MFLKIKQDDKGYGKLEKKRKDSKSKQFKNSGVGVPKEEMVETK